mmetsp:Transcript_21588/g.36148  ORF Transcript_21588/g.36148 Transcript_21588/m.36148 type:complete len:336 (+) Transcript_21588:1716-2723(+)
MPQLPRRNQRTITSASERRYCITMILVDSLRLIRGTHHDTQRGHNVNDLVRRGVSHVVAHRLALVAVHVLQNQTQLRDLRAHGGWSCRFHDARQPNIILRRSRNRRWQRQFLSPSNQSPGRRVDEADRELGGRWHELLQQLCATRHLQAQVPVSVSRGGAAFVWLLRLAVGGVWQTAPLDDAPVLQPRRDEALAPKGEPHLRHARAVGGVAVPLHALGRRARKRVQAKVALRRARGEEGLDGLLHFLWDGQRLVADDLVRGEVRAVTRLLHVPAVRAEKRRPLHVSHRGNIGLKARVIRIEEKELSVCGVGAQPLPVLRKINVRDGGGVAFALAY